MKKTLFATLILGSALCTGCGDSATVIQPGEGYEMTRQEKANEAKFNATRDREHIKEEEENDPKAKKKKALKETRSYGR